MGGGRFEIEEDLVGGSAYEAHGAKGLIDDATSTKTSIFLCEEGGHGLESTRRCWRRRSRGKPSSLATSEAVDQRRRKHGKSIIRGKFAVGVC